MFRKRSFILTLIFVLGMLSACNFGGENESSGEQTENQTENTEAKEEKGGNDASSQSEESDKGDAETDEAPDTTEEDTEPAYYVSEETASIIPIDDANEDVVLLTIDDAPDNYALEMAETLQEKGVKAIFFVNGHFLEDEEGKEKLKKIHEMGFPIGNHTYSHPVLPDISEEEQTEQIVTVNDQIEEIIGERPKFFRAPHGANTDHTRELARQEGMLLMNWTYGYDYFEPYEDADKLKEAMITGEGPEVDVNYSLLKPGANLLMHDREWTTEALGDIVDGLQDQGYEIVDPHLIETLE
ncbi:polysaccharide deacetylase family protein [Oceanobacillus sp. J11TS1]|uniref:polysaccharide deacetylase family protein n=1 Tax=Oceanobacillus sp. J11TS1 TaxID=2807191 RepID=UPI001AFD0931|nr:polysaccharide deacetylase family protein [Oceanobacillus sp. J11TS1]GIO22346.1 hypothetical protein J11TS1_09270 [Oceanobacillus sp. J11TS1]